MSVSKIAGLKHITASIIGLFVFSIEASAGPTGGQVVAGDATISTPNSTTTTIDQTSQRGIIEWDRFNVDADEQLKFSLPSPKAITLNRVTGGHGPSTINGRIDSNGRIIISNGDGIVFGAGARIDVGALIATTADIENDAFMNGSLEFDRSGSPKGRVINRGMISAKDSGLIALVAPYAENSGVLAARVGRIAVAGADRFTVDFTSSEFLRLAIDPDNPAAKYLAKNSGRIEAEGGHVLLTTQTASDALSGVVNNSGIIEATAVDTSGGRIRLVAGGRSKVRNSGTVRSRGKTGGTIEITAESVELTSSSIIDASGEAGGGTVLLGGDYLGGNASLAASMAFAPALEDRPVYNATTLVAQSGSVVRADALASGDGGKVILWSNEYTLSDATISARAGYSFGNGGIVETSSKGTLDVRSAPDVSAPNGQAGTWLLDPLDITIVSGLESQNTDVDGNLVQPIDTGSELSNVLLSLALSSGNDVVITTANSEGSESGDVVFDADIALSGTNDGSLTVFAADDIMFSEGVSVVADQGELDVTLVANDRIRANDLLDFELAGGTLHLISGDDISFKSESDTPDKIRIENVLSKAANSVDIGLSFGNDQIAFSYTEDIIEIEAGGIEINDSSNRSELEIDLAGPRRDLILHDRAINGPEDFEWQIPSNTLRTRSTVAADANNGIAEVIGDPNTSFFRTGGTEPNGNSIGLIEVSFDDGTGTDKIFVTTDAGQAVLDAEAAPDPDVEVEIPETDPTLPNTPDPTDPNAPETPVAEEPVEQEDPVEETPSTEPNPPTEPQPESDTPTKPQPATETPVSGGGSGGGGGGSSQNPPADPSEPATSKETVGSDDDAGPPAPSTPPIQFAVLSPENAQSVFPVIGNTAGTTAQQLPARSLGDVAAEIRTQVDVALSGASNAVTYPLELRRNIQGALTDIEKYAQTLPPGERNQFMWDATSMVLGVTGVGTPISVGMDVLSAGYSAVDGRFVDAGLGVFAIVPFVGDAGAFAAKYGEHAPAVYGIISKRLGKNVDEATVVPSGGVPGAVATNTTRLTNADFPTIRSTVSQKQNRHIEGRPEYRGGGTLSSQADAQRVLDAYHGSNVEILGSTSQGFPVVRFNVVTGTNNNVGAGITNQPTNVFIIKGTASPSVVPTNPNWTP